MAVVAWLVVVERGGGGYADLKSKDKGLASGIEESENAGEDRDNTDDGSYPRMLLSLPLPLFSLMMLMLMLMCVARRSGGGRQRRWIGGGCLLLRCGCRTMMVAAQVAREEESVCATVCVFIGVNSDMQGEKERRKKAWGSEAVLPVHGGGWG